jgi:aerobic C4-dicarboxylate transport protein
MSKLLNSLFLQVVVALFVGVALGFLYPPFAVELKPLGDGFIKLIKMAIAPVVFCVVVHGIVGAGDLKKVGRVGVKAIVYFEIVTTLALFLGVILAYVLQPGAGMNIDPKSLDPTALSSYQQNVGHVGHWVDFLLKIIPFTVGEAFTKGDILQVLLFAILSGSALALIGERGKPVAELIDSTQSMLFTVIMFIVRLAPLGVLGAVAFTVGKYGIASLKQLGYLVALFYLTCAIFVIGVLGGIMRLAGFNILKFLNYLREELLVVLGTASSDSVLPQVMEKLERMGVKDSTVGLVIPTGYSFNLDGFSIYLTLAAIFIAQATNTALSMSDLLTILGVSLLTSKGAHGVPGSAIVVLAATLSAMPVIPAIGLVLVLAVDWFMGIGRALTNLIGNCVATVVIGAWEGDIDRAQAERVLNGEIELNRKPGAEEAVSAPFPAR